MRIGSYKTDGGDEPHDFILLDNNGEFVDVEVPIELGRIMVKLQDEAQLAKSKLAKEVCPKCGGDGLKWVGSHPYEFTNGLCLTCQGKSKRSIDKQKVEAILEAWQDTGTDYVVASSFSGIAHEIIALIEDSGWHDA